MGLELKRVPLDFDWPIDKIWKGYINPHDDKGVKCVKCDGGGYAPLAKAWSDKWYGNAPFDPVETDSEPFTSKHPAVIAFATRNYMRDQSFYSLNGRYDRDVAISREACRLADLFDKQWVHHLADEDVQALFDAGRLRDFKTCPDSSDLNERYLFGLGHDCINHGICIKARCERAGEPCYCPACEGHGTIYPDAEAKKRFDEWERVEPPTGPGYQIFEIVSEGSPISPVFSGADQLAHWMSMHNRGCDKGTTYEQWLAFINGPGWAPSLVVHRTETKTTVQTGVQSVADQELNAGRNEASD